MCHGPCRIEWNDTVLTLCDQFINSDDDVTLAHLFDALSMAIPDADSQDTQYIKFNNLKFIELITKVDMDGPGASLTQRGQSQTYWETQGMEHWDFLCLS